MQKFFGKVVDFGKRCFAFVAAGATAVVASVQSSYAALTTDQQSVVTGVQTLITDMTTVMWALVLAVTGGLIGVGIFKKFLWKGTGC